MGVRGNYPHTRMSPLQGEGYPSFQEVSQEPIQRENPEIPSSNALFELLGTGTERWHLKEWLNVLTLQTIP